MQIFLTYEFGNWLHALTRGSYSHSWLPFRWWHLSIITGPFSLDTSRHRSSVRISLLAVYEKTCKHDTWSFSLHDKSNDEMIDRERERERNVLTWLPPMPWQLKMPTFSFSFRAMLSRHWLVSTLRICEIHRHVINSSCREMKLCCSTLGRSAACGNWRTDEIYFCSSFASQT